MKLIVFTLLCISCFCAEAQNTFLAKEDKRLAKLFEKVFHSKYLDRQEIAEKWQPMLEKEMIQLLQKKESSAFPFAELFKQIDIIYSPDSSFRLFTWNTRLGGSIPEIYTLLQYNNKGEVYAKDINDRMLDGMEMDRSIKYNCIVKVDSNSYLFRGYSRYGSLVSSASLALFKLENGEPVPIENAFEMRDFENNKKFESALYMNYTPDDPFIPVVVGETKKWPNIDSINTAYKSIHRYDTICSYIKYDINTKVLAYPETGHENEDGSYSGMTGKMLHLHYNGQVFTRKEE